MSFDCDCGPSDIVRHGQDGLLAPKEDVPALAAALNQLMSDETMRKDFGQNAIEDTRFDLGQIILKWENVLT